MLDTFLTEIQKKPEDWNIRMVLADWYEDNGRSDLAECLRWVSSHKKRPYHGSSKVFTWFNADRIQPGLGDPESDIPEAVYQLLTGGQEIADHKVFPSMHAAEEALQNAWLAARQQGWNDDS